MKTRDWDIQKFTRIEIEINHDCNRKCWYCPNAVSSRKSSGEMSQDVFLKLMDELNSINYSGEVSFHFYNEPMLAKNFIWYVRTARDRLPQSKLELYTNGTLLTYERFQETNNAGIDRFIVTKHFDERNYAFDSTFTQLNEAEKKKVLFQAHNDIHLTNRGGVIEAGPSSIPALSPCYIPSFLLVVTHDGNVLPCFEDFHEELFMGNFLKEGLINIWNSEKYKKFRSDLRKGKRHAYGPCKKCNRLEVLPE